MNKVIASPNNVSIEMLVNYGGKLLVNSSDSAKLDSKLLLSFVLNKPTSYLFTWPEKKPEKQQVDAFIALLQRRLNGEPIAYIVGYKEFWSLPLKVSPATLIPRPDTETLVEQVLLEFDSYSEQPLCCLDLGTGTGAIALALASELPKWQLDAVDFSLDAVKLAQENADTLAINNISVFQSDWFSNVEKGKKYNVIVTNPPYIDKDDHHLDEGDIRFEPKSALVADNHGYHDIEHITAVARTFLADNGAIFIEHGYEQAQIVATILAEHSFQNIKTIKDLSGNDRITAARWFISDSGL